MLHPAPLHCQGIDICFPLHIDHSSIQDELIRVEVLHLGLITMPTNKHQKGHGIGILEGLHSNLYGDNLLQVYLNTYHQTCNKNGYLLGYSLIIFQCH